MASRKTTNVNVEPSAYDADALQKLDPIDHIRKRIGMYLGDNTGAGGLTTALREILDNSQDEFLNGHGSLIKLTFFEDRSVQVQDSGRGIPTGINTATGLNGIVLSLGNVGAGGKFNAAGSGYGGGSGGLNGVGTTASNAISERFDVTVYQHGKEHRISFRQGIPGHFAKDNDPTAKFSPSKDLKAIKDPRSVEEKKTRPTGTTIRMWPDYDLFAPEVIEDPATGETTRKPAEFDVETIKFRLKSSAFLLPGLRIEIDDYRNPNHPVHDVYDFEGGLPEMLPTLTNAELVSKPVHLVTEGTFTEMASIMEDDGKTRIGEVERHVDIDVAFAYTDSYDDPITKSFVNIINTKHGGTHENGYWRAMSREFTNYIKNTKGILKAKEEPPTMDDVKEGVVAAISIKFPEPQFTGQEKSTLGTNAILSVVSQAVGNQLKLWMENKKNAAQLKLIVTKITEATRTRLAEKTFKETQRRKTSLESASMPAKLVDCNSTGTEFSELHICEGDSALGTMRKARDSRYQALLPIRGKILNVQKATLPKMLDNAECTAIIQVVGAGSGKSFELDQMRYHNICIAVDADVDGAHIRTLLITFFYKYMRPLIEAGRLYATQPPLYVLKTTGKNRKIHYLFSDSERDALLKKLDAAGTKYEPLQRLKGLGEMDADEFRETTLSPETRTLRRITINDAERATSMLELSMGNKVETRKNWIMESREKLDDAVLE